MIINKKKNFDKHVWKDELLQLLNLQPGEYQMKDIELQLFKISRINGGNSRIYITLNKEMVNILKLPPRFAWIKKIRLSDLMSQFIKKFIINNDRPYTKYYSSDFEFYCLDNKLIDKILNNL